MHAPVLFGKRLQQRTKNLVRARRVHAARVPQAIEHLAVVDQHEPVGRRFQIAKPLQLLEDRRAASRAGHDDRGVARAQPLGQKAGDIRRGSSRIPTVKLDDVLVVVPEGRFTRSILRVDEFPVKPSWGLL